MRAPRSGWSSAAPSRRCPRASTWSRTGSSRRPSPTPAGTRRGRPSTVELRYGENALRLRVRDDGPGPSGSRRRPRPARHARARGGGGRPTAGRSGARWRLRGRGGPAAMTIRVVVADDQQIVREGFSALLETQADITVVGSAADGEQAIRVCTEQQPDIVLMDVRMPGVDGIEATRRLAGAGGWRSHHHPHDVRSRRLRLRRAQRGRERLPAQGRRRRAAVRGGARGGGRRGPARAGRHAPADRRVRAPAPAPCGLRRSS